VVWPSGGSELERKIAAEICLTHVILISWFTKEGGKRTPKLGGSLSENGASGKVIGAGLPSLSTEEELVL